jgi:hypothetical protein
MSNYIDCVPNSLSIPIEEFSTIGENVLLIVSEVDPNKTSTGRYIICEIKSKSFLLKK